MVRLTAIPAAMPQATTPEEVVAAVLAESENLSRPVLRGQTDADWDPGSGDVHRLKSAPSDDLPDDVNEMRDLAARHQKDSLSSLNSRDAQKSPMPHATASR